MRLPVALCHSMFLTSVVATTTFLAAQTLDRGQIEGRITDQTGGVLPGVQVTVSEVNTGLKRSVLTGETGQYSAVLLPLGTYVVEAELPGFTAFQSNEIRLRIGQLLVVNITLQVAGAGQIVEVVAPAGAAPAGVSSVLEERNITDLPINGRDFRDFAQLSATSQTIRGTRGTFRLGGQPGDYVQLNLDGADCTKLDVVFSPGVRHIHCALVPQHVLGRRQNRRLAELPHTCDDGLRSGL